MHAGNQKDNSLAVAGAETLGHSQGVMSKEHVFGHCAALGCVMSSRDTQMHAIGCTQESKKDNSLAVAGAKRLEYGQVVMSADNIFGRCAARSRIGHAPETSPLAQLEVIGNFVSDLGVIIRQQRDEARRKAAKADDS